MENSAQLSCPKCNSNRVHFRSKAREWECLDCESRFLSDTQQISSQSHPLLASKTNNPKVIFFSYGHDDNTELVDRFQSDLETRGHSVWIDHKEIGVWDDWKGKISKGIDDSNLALAFLSKHSTRDPGVCRNEVALALDRHKPVYPVLLEPVGEVSPPVTICHLQWQDLSQWRDIRAGKVKGKEWARWYEEKLIQTITLVEGEASEFEGDISGLREVLKPVSFSGDIARYIPDFCGRQWVFDAYQDWLDKRPQSRLFWIKAGPGIGKSAIAAMLAHTRQSAVVGAWICQAHSLERRDMCSALCTIAFQLSTRWEDYRRKLRYQLGLNASTKKDDWKELREVILKKSEADLFNLLFIESLTGLIWREQRLVVVIDALDEATDEHGQNSLVELLVKRLAHLPPWLNFVVTSRPNPDVVAKLQGFAPFELDAEDARNYADLKAYLDVELAKYDAINSLPESKQDHIKNALLENSEGMILYLEQVFINLKEGALLVETISQTPRGLYSQYRIAFDHHFGGERLEKLYVEQLKPLLRLLLATPGPLPPELAQRILGWDTETYLQRCNRLGAYVQDTPQGCRLFHKTLYDWLEDKTNFPYYLDPLPAKKEMATVLWDCFANANQQVDWRLQIQDWLPNMMPLIPQWEDAGALDKLALYLSDAYRFAEAEKLLRRALHLREDLLGANTPDVCASLNNLGYMLQNRGDYISAESYLRRSMEMHDTFASLKDEDLAILLNNLACLLHDRGDDVEAEQLHRRALDIREMASPQNDKDIATSLNNLASVLQAKQDYLLAENLLRRAIEIREHISNAPQDLATSLNNLGSLLCKKGDFALAEPLLSRAIEIRETIYGSVHPDVANSLDHLALVKNAKGQYRKAELLLERALNIREETLGPDHPALAESFNNLGWIYYSRGMYDKAEPLYLRSLAITEMKEGAESTRAADTHINLGRLMEAAGNYASAIASFQRALAIRERRLGIEDQRTSEARDDLTQCKAKMNGIAGMNRAERRQIRRKNRPNIH